MALVASRVTLRRRRGSVGIVNENLSVNPFSVTKKDLLAWERNSEAMFKPAILAASAIFL
jgi:hypothetical protein